MLMAAPAATVALALLPLPNLPYPVCLQSASEEARRQLKLKGKKGNSPEEDEEGSNAAAAPATEAVQEA